MSSPTTVDEAARVDACAVVGLRVALTHRPGVDVVDDIDLTLSPGEVVGLVGESGSGKTTVGTALLGYSRDGAFIEKGRVMLGDRDVLSLRWPLAVEPRVLEVEVAGAGHVVGLADWLADTRATSLVVVDGGTVVHEWYAQGHGPGTLFLGASMTKSVLAHLVGLAVTDGSLRLQDSVTDHVPELAGSGYDGCVIDDVLTMTTGVDWVEDHRDPDGPAARLLACFLGTYDSQTAATSRALLRIVGSKWEPGTQFEYRTADSQVLDWVRERATGQLFADALGDLWADLGCQDDAAVAVDGVGTGEHDPTDAVALAGGGLAATARDWARIGLLAVDGTA
ncbi:MAG: serine hydrolase, partial [Ilumatobacteraceae bacterium]